MVSDITIILDYITLVVGRGVFKGNVRSHEFEFKSFSMLPAHNAAEIIHN